MNILYHGRFQPPHKGHIKLINCILKKYHNSKMFIVIDIRKKDKKNPFTFEYRKNRFIRKLKNKNIEIIGHKPKKYTFEDCLNSIYNKIKDKNINLIIAGPKLNKKIIKFWNHKKIKVELAKNRFFGISATNIRKKIHVNYR